MKQKLYGSIIIVVLSLVSTSWMVMKSLPDLRQAREYVRDVGGVFSETLTFPFPVACTQQQFTSVETITQERFVELAVSGKYSAIYVSPLRNAIAVRAFTRGSVDVSSVGYVKDLAVPQWVILNEINLSPQTPTVVEVRAVAWTPRLRGVFGMTMVIFLLCWTVLFIVCYGIWVALKRYVRHT